MKMKLLTLSSTIVLMTSVTTLPAPAGSFADDADFLRKHTDLIVLSDKAGRAKVAIAPAWQGRVMTSTAGGDGGLSCGFINRELIASGKLRPHMNAFGGEDRFWLGPEGGQFSIFFAAGVPFDLEHWFTPAPIDTMPYRVASQSSDGVKFTAEFALTNFSGTRFEVKVDRDVRLLPSSSAWQKLGISPIPGVDLVGFETDNRITNRGKDPWKKPTGLLSIWILGMFNPSPSTTIVVPIVPGPDNVLGAKVTSDYFGSIPAERLKVADDVVYFSGDGKLRSKIGISPRRSRAVLGSYDAANKVLTIVQFTSPGGATDYVNSLWKIQDNPYGGDAANSYNDGPPAPGARPLGPFYELESSSTAAALAAGHSVTHVHRTIHLSGPEWGLDPVARTALGVSLMEIRSALKRP
jgi:hypothetical protein